MSKISYNRGDLTLPDPYIAKTHTSLNQLLNMRSADLYLTLFASTLDPQCVRHYNTKIQKYQNRSTEKAIHKIFIFMRTSPLIACNARFVCRVRILIQVQTCLGDKRQAWCQPIYQLVVSLGAVVQPLVLAIPTSITWDKQSDWQGLTLEGIKKKKACFSGTYVISWIDKQG